MKTWCALIGCFMKLVKFIWLAEKLSWFHGFHGDGLALVWTAALHRFMKRPIKARKFS
jgi:hypothetical protein